VVVGTTDTQTLTNKTLNLTSNTLVATSAQLAAAVTDETGTGALVFAVSPALTGTPTAPTAAVGTNTTQLATTAHVFAERAATATLTNKTITGGTVNPTTLQEGSSPAVIQTDIGTAPNEIPLNQYLGNLAFQDAANIAGNVGVGGALNVAGTSTLTGSVGVGATPNASALLDVQSTTKGVRMPNMTTAQKNAIASPAAGLIVFDTTLSKLSVYSGVAWETVTSI
jgi:hypothetical protein